MLPSDQMQAGFPAQAMLCPFQDVTSGGPWCLFTHLKLILITQSRWCPMSSLRGYHFFLLLTDKQSMRRHLDHTHPVTHQNFLLDSLMIPACTLSLIWCLQYDSSAVKRVVVVVSPLNCVQLFAMSQSKLDPMQEGKWSWKTLLNYWQNQNMNRRLNQSTI